VPLPSQPLARDHPTRGMKGISSQARKAKGRKLQQMVATRLRDTFPSLQGNDVRSLSMGAAGDDLILSTEALLRIPYSFEMKWHETLNLWSALAQVDARLSSTATYPAVVVKKSRQEPLVVLPFGHWCNLHWYAATPRPPTWAAASAADPSEPVAPMVGFLDLVPPEDPAPQTSAALARAVHATMSLARRQATEPAVAAHDGLAVRLPAVAARQGVAGLPRARVTVRLQRQLNLWATWPPLAAQARADAASPALVFCRGPTSEGPVFVVLPYDQLFHLLRSRWCHLRLHRMKRLDAELASEHDPAPIAMTT